ncbi:MAG: hypothetical protein HYS60_02390 [Candidatus Wildermuthbacteria bacterium]|nr:hypothetical protein [Candidatus Wildermuthbacteria bacterium]
MSPLELIQKSQVIEIAPGSGADSGDLGEALAIFHALSNLGKSMRFKEGFFSLPSAEWMDKSSFPLQSAAISLKGMASCISHVSYEKSEQDLRFSFSLSQGQLNPEHVQLEPSPDPDLTIIVGEKEALHNQEITTNPHFRFWNSGKALEISLSLLSPFQIPSEKLLLRTLHSIIFSREHQLCLASLEKRDFRDTQTNTKDIRSVFQSLISWAKPEVSFLCLLESSPKNRVQGILRTGKAELRKKFSLNLGAKEKGSWALFDFPHNNMRLAKEKVVSLLQP